MTEGMPIKQTVGSLKADEGGRCSRCMEIADVTLYETDVEFVALCNGCDREDDNQRYGRA